MEIKDFTPSKGRIVIKKTKELTKVVEVEKPDYNNPIVDNPEKQGEHDLDEPMPVVPTITVKEKATRGVQIGEVVAAHPEDIYKVGQKIVYGIYTLKEFDLVKGKYGLLDIYNVLGVIS